MSLYNLTRAKKSKKVFTCKKCQQEVDIKHARPHFNYHLQQDTTGLRRYGGHCDQTFLMYHDASRELMYHRHVYACLSGRPCSGQRFAVMPQRVKNDNLLSPFLINSQRAENIDKKVTAVSAHLGSEPTTLAADQWELTPPAAPTLLSPRAAQIKTGDDGAPLLSAAAQTQYIEKIEAMNVENYWKEKKNQERIGRSLALALGQFADPLRRQKDTAKNAEDNGKGRKLMLFNEGIADHRRFFRRLLAIVHKKLQQHSKATAVFFCCITGKALPINRDLLQR